MQNPTSGQNRPNPSEKSHLNDADSLRLYQAKTLINFVISCLFYNRSLEELETIEVNGEGLWVFLRHIEELITIEE